MVRSLLCLKVTGIVVAVISILLSVIYETPWYTILLGLLS